jgi:sirohydrochlorin ferrochelatase
MSTPIDALLLLGHGSRKSDANRPLEDLARMTAEELGVCRFAVAYLQFAQPTMEQAVEDLTASGARRIVIMPFFLFPGAHITEDVPLEITRLRERFPRTELLLAPHLGVHPLLARVAAERVREVTG